MTSAGTPLTPSAHSGVYSACFFLRSENTVVQDAPSTVKVPSSAGFAAASVWAAFAPAAVSHTKKGFCSPVSGSSASASSAWSRRSLPVETSTRNGSEVWFSTKSSS